MTARKLTVYSAARAELATFEKKYNSLVVDCSTTEGMKSAKDCRKEIRDARSNLEDLRKETKAPVLEKGKQIDTEAKAISATLTKLFEKFDSAIKTIENKEALAAQAALEEAATKTQELDAREQAIFEKEIELGLRKAPKKTAEDKHTDASDNDDTNLPADDSSTSDVHSTVQASSDIETICEPHIKVAGDRLAVLKSIRNLVEPTDAQPTGDIDADIARNHDEVLADIWELVDVFK